MIHRKSNSTLPRNGDGRMEDGYNGDINMGSGFKPPQSKYARYEGKTAICMICSSVLKECRPYYKRYRICPDCASKEHVVFNDKKMRFCQQCGKLQDVELFDGLTRTCKERLMKHAERRRNAAQARRELRRDKEMPNKKLSKKMLLNARQGLGAFGDYESQRREVGDTATLRHGNRGLLPLDSTQAESNTVSTLIVDGYSERYPQQGGSVFGAPARIQRPVPLRVGENGPQQIVAQQVHWRILEALGICGHTDSMSIPPLVYSNNSIADTTFARHDEGVGQSVRALLLGPSQDNYRVQRDQTVSGYAPGMMRNRPDTNAMQMNKQEIELLLEKLKRIRRNDSN